MKIQKQYQCSWNDIPKEIQNPIIILLDVRTLDHLRCTSRENRKRCDLESVLTHPSFNIQRLCNDFDLCERGLIHYAQLNKRRMFYYLWGNQSQKDKKARNQLIRLAKPPRAFKASCFLAYQYSQEKKKQCAWWRERALRGLQKDWRYLRILLAHGLSPNEIVDNVKKLSLLHEAVRLGDLKSVKILVNNGAWIDMLDVWGETPLHCACENNRVKIARYLMSRGASINKLNGCNETPLYSACSNGCVSLVKLLLAKGADAIVGDDPRSIAYFEGHTKIISLFDAYGISLCTDERIVACVKDGILFLITLGLLCLDNIIVGDGGRAPSDSSMPLLFY